jgi:hypothetical protein
MKNKFLSQDQVNKNLEAIFPGKGKCLTALNGFYVIDFPGHGTIVIDEKKQVFIRWSSDRHQQKKDEYLKYCNEWIRIVIEKQFTVKGKVLDFMPFIYDKKTATEGLKQQQEQFLQCVGYGKKVKEETDAEVLKRLAGKDYADIYKLLIELDISRAYVTSRITATGDVKILKVIHSRGECAFPIHKLTGDPETDRQVRDIFYRAVGLPVSTFQKAA